MLVLWSALTGIHKGCQPHSGERSIWSLLWRGARKINYTTTTKKKKEHHWLLQGWRAGVVQHFSPSAALDLEQWKFRVRSGSWCWVSLRHTAQAARSWGWDTWLLRRVYTGYIMSSEDKEENYTTKSCCSSPRIPPGVLLGCQSIFSTLMVLKEVTKQVLFFLSNSLCSSPLCLS